MADGAAVLPDVDSPTQNPVEPIAPPTDGSLGRGRSVTLLFLTGINLTLLHFLLFRHVAIAVRQADQAVPLCSLAYFSGVSIGYAFSHRITPAALRGMLPGILITQLGLIALAQPLYDIIRDEASTLVAGTTLFLVIALGVTSLHSVFLPRLIEEHGDLRKCYSIEVIGSIVGLVLAAGLSALDESLVIAAYAGSFLWVAWLVALPLSSWARCVGIGLLFFLCFPWIDQQTSTWFYQRYYSSSGVEDTIHTRYSPYHKVEVLDLDNGENMLLLNGKRQFAGGSHHTYSYFVAEFPAQLLGEPRVCLLGCGSMSTVGRIGDFVDSIDIVDLDPAVFETSAEFFPQYNRLDDLDNWTFTADDAKHYAATTDQRYDLILHDIPPARSRQTAMTYTAEFFTNVKRCLTPQGIFSISCMTPLSKRSRYGHRMMATLTSVFDRYFILMHRGTVYFFGGGENLPPWTHSMLRKAIDHRDRKKVSIRTQHEVDDLAKGASIITIDNVGELIFE